ncbi:hypothetical protein K456DRAFT_1162802 [Colletotrichum gloeosporioides 23]|nr:hypothetical protein K456DRAFT_1162802 [Colletotrichum gloeosporioides 23]
MACKVVTSSLPAISQSFRKDRLILVCPTPVVLIEARLHVQLFRADCRAFGYSAQLSTSISNPGGFRIESSVILDSRIRDADSTPEGHVSSRRPVFAGNSGLQHGLYSGPRTRRKRNSVSKIMPTSSISSPVALRGASQLPRDCFIASDLGLFDGACNNVAMRRRALVHRFAVSTEHQLINCCRSSPSKHLTEFGQLKRSLLVR